MGDRESWRRRQRECCLQHDRCCSRVIVMPASLPPYRGSIARSSPPISQSLSLSAFARLKGLTDERRRTAAHEERGTDDGSDGRGRERVRDESETHQTRDDRRSCQRDLAWHELRSRQTCHCVCASVSLLLRTFGRMSHSTGFALTLSSSTSPLLLCCLCLSVRLCLA